MDVDKELFVAGREDLGQSWFFGGRGCFELVNGLLVRFGFNRGEVNVRGG